MSGWKTVVALSLAVLLAGCITATGDGPGGSEKQEEPVPVEQTLDWSGEVSMDGAGWVFVYRAREEPVVGHSLTFSMDYLTQPTEGPHSVAVFGPVSVLELGDGTLSPQLDFFLNRVERSEDGSSIEHSSVGFSASSGGQNPVAGFLFVVAADSAFSFGFEIEVEDAVLDEERSFDASGNGSTFHYAGGLPGAAATYKTLSVELEEPGWSHFEILAGEGVSGPALRGTDVRFPSERTESHLEWYVPSYGNPPMSHAGVIRDTPGSFFAQSLIVEPRIDLELMLLHMPGVYDELGPGWRTGAYHSGSPPVFLDAGFLDDVDEQEGAESEEGAF